MGRGGRKEPDPGAEQGAVIESAPVRRARRKDGLVRFARDATSQSGEDGIIAAIFGCLDAYQGDPDRWCVDIGAWDGAHLSNTHSLLTAEGSRWSGVLVEADPERAEALAALHRPLGNVALEAYASCVDESRSITGLLRNTEAPRVLDLLSIDVDGCDYWLWRDLLEAGEYEARVVCVEFNPTMPHDLHYAQPRADGVRHGSSLAALVALAAAHGYSLVETTLYNAFFVDAATRAALVCDGLARDDDDIDTLHEVTMGTSLYQLYDGTLKLHGCKKLLWHRLPIDEARLQVIEEPKFPFAPPAPAPDGESSLEAD
eukprot:CAMPEP_0119277856 /NCGR_PEP_ID=MMETSP1329-20130426/18030_1 /TAXON_ID=114041 /ORGANISM="Genus nov. species nov., Strain RCC1024" /LENGTH=314 /DNA_ID=CAMNT_0007278349 /DNA_START=127 /DNA_END=1068 /DNA_ORIENTATION=+